MKYNLLYNVLLFNLIIFHHLLFHICIKIYIMQSVEVYTVLRDGLIDIDYIKLNTVILNIGQPILSLT
jgi:hypothetical protein